MVKQTHLIVISRGTRNPGGLTGSERFLLSAYTEQAILQTPFGQALSSPKKIPPPVRQGNGGIQRGCGIFNCTEVGLIGRHEYHLLFRSVPLIVKDNPYFRRKKAGISRLFG